VGLPITFLPATKRQNVREIFLNGAKNSTIQQKHIDDSTTTPGIKHAKDIAELSLVLGKGRNLGVDPMTFFERLAGCSTGMSHIVVKHERLPQPTERSGMRNWRAKHQAKSQIL
jgi:hypothetical protein